MAGRLHIPRLAKPVAAVMARDEPLIAGAVARLEEMLGPADCLSELYRFNFTDYYRAEMGETLLKRFASFSRLIRPGELVKIKRRTAACERKYRDERGGRLVNLDPGYWSDAKLVLASTKNYSHRVCLGRRVFAELCLRCHQGRLQPFDWTYPDYRTELALEFFEGVRKKYLKQLGELQS